ncbi:MAG: Mth938-like domain-containing protein [Desulfobacterales bacterium]|nr:MAG: Mth938-like domain-containing protein [Desulfobacterales bacterium]UCD90152.1 MAG: Mth938-like domain-containing protein [Desulfobacterales bacterium]
MIEKYAFGQITINGISYTSDIKITQGRVIPSWWRQSGHQVGIEDIQDILDTKPEILVLGKGEPGMMSSKGSLREWLSQKNIGLIEEKTAKAVQTFNRLLAEGKKVAAGFHLSC